MSRKLFGTDGIRGEANAYPLVSSVALKLGRALASTVKDEPGKAIIIGKDTRLSGYMLETALVSGIVSMGVDVYLVGPLPTPAVAHLTRSMNAKAGVMITASHNPAQDNGIKIFDKDGYKLPDEQEASIEELMFSKDIYDLMVGGTEIGKAYRIDEANGRYIEFAKSTVQDKRFNGLKIVLDCANGAAYDVAPKVFEELGAEVVVLNDKPDGLNINLNCGAVHPENTAKEVVKHGADIGVTLDGDADRLIVCDENGEVLDGDYILTFCAYQMLKNNALRNNTLVVTDYSNMGVEEGLKKMSGKVVRTGNGDRYVIEAMRKGDFNLGGEASGHMIFSDYVSTGDGVISALQLLKLISSAGIKVSEMRKYLTKNPQILDSFDVSEKTPFDEMPLVAKKIEEIEEKLKGQGRLLLRYSGTEKKCRIMIEGKEREATEALVAELASSIKHEIGV